MPNLKQQVSYPKGANFYESLDILSGFDYALVVEESRKCFDVYKFCGSPQGWIKTSQVLQNRMLYEILQPIDLSAKDDMGII